MPLPTSFRLLALLLCLLAGALSGGLHCNGSRCQAQEPAVAIINNRSGANIEFAELIARLQTSDVIFLGEKHDNDAGHAMQLRIIEALHAAGCDLAIGMEQFERDTQGAVDDYLAGKISEDEFLAASRPWKNYPEHYRSIVEFAKANKLPILAGNLPRKLATAISEGRELDTHELVFAARATTAPQDRYWANFLRSMQGHMGADGDEKLLKFYAAQCAKDDAMAEAITDHLARNRHRPRKVIQLCGHFHSDYGLGTVARVQNRLPLVHCSVVTMELPPSDETAKPAPLESDRAHYTLVTPANTPK